MVQSHHFRASAWRVRMSVVALIATIFFDAGICSEGTIASFRKYRPLSGSTPNSCPELICRAGSLINGTIAGIFTARSLNREHL